MKTKVVLELLPKTKKNIIAEVVLEKTNHDEASGTLKNTILELDFKDRITLDELDSIAAERKDYKIVFGKSQLLVCPAEAVTGVGPSGKRYFYLRVQISDTVFRNFFFTRRQKTNIEDNKVKYHFEFTEKVNDEAISMLDLINKKDLEDESNTEE